MAASSDAAIRFGGITQTDIVLSDQPSVVKKARIALPTEEFEGRARSLGHRTIVGIDEVGRGALAGPVVAAAVQLPEHCAVEGIRDSKVIREDERERLYEEIVQAAISWSVGVVDNGEVDRINIRQATFAAMRMSVESLVSPPDYVLIDGKDVPELGGMPTEAIIRGDGLCRSIAAASIVAKVTRDRFMREQHHAFPQYGFSANKGYGTVKHRTAIQEHGPCSIHRLSFLGTILQERLPI